MSCSVTNDCSWKNNKVDDPSCVLGAKQIRVSDAYENTAPIPAAWKIAKLKLNLDYESQRVFAVAIESGINGCA